MPDDALTWWSTNPQAIADASELLPIEKAWTWTMGGHGTLIRVSYATWPDIRVVIRPNDSAVEVGGVFGPGGDLRQLQYEAVTGPVTARMLRQLPAIVTLTEWERIGRQIARLILVDHVPDDRLVIDGSTAAEALARLTAASRPRPAQPRARGERSRDLTRRAAELYRQAVTAGDPRPRTTVGRQLGYSSAHVGRLLMAARRPQPDGSPPLLGPALRGKPGEAQIDDRSTSRA
jgi:hypothetical protein